MLKITIEAPEEYNAVTQEFINNDAVTLELEHSLASLSKWEEVWEKPFLGSDEKTEVETIDYIRAMTLTTDVPPEVYSRLTRGNVDEISAYIQRKMTATWFVDLPQSPGAKATITAEIIYNWMVALNIPFECQHWHLNKLLTLIKVCNEKNNPPKKMTRAEAAAKQRQLNAERRAKYGSSG